MTDIKLFDELKERGLINQCTDEEKLEKILKSGEPIVLYEGSDPTMDSLHIGHCIPFCLLRKFQKAGHKVIVLMGGATACIGDPTGKTEMRKMLSKQEIQHNIDEIKNTLGVFLDFDGENPAIIVNNADWYEGLDYVDFMREIGVHFNVNKMLSSEIYANRLENGGLTFFEMGYMLMQAYDFVYLNKKYGCSLQFGGQDQWGNIVAGVELQRKLNFANGTDINLIGATNPLLVTPEGKKMGKTEKGAIWIKKDRISAYDFYQGIYQTPDSCLRMMFALFTDIPMSEVDDMLKKDIVGAKKKLCFDITKFVRGEQDAIKAQEASESLFGAGENMQDVPTIRLDKSALSSSIIDICVISKLTPSKGEARRLIQQNGITLNEQKVSIDRVLLESDFTRGYALLKKGKKMYIKLEIL